ncbi:N(4)-(beta-N-acetylglucosaminyl)-L-asparaginase [Pontibacter sp. G13]|uniref:isoaspartyl peptidase/L-asparaginase family protein n=1 Tax=Pontibacter sp. G13 TaxID=3074898 RepID=UPI002889A35E|nr:N(4)-(beta-N-acetylglucosaminyl)-L-asparaginase [Pontibacter sp. G13]WNJ17824.1 N(4)-(beta-N-acetylglucosaminyl)-L-asparaginase [Pontibacter sp. G13]
MNNRRQFLKTMGVAAAASWVSTAWGRMPAITQKRSRPLVISTWNHGIPANEAAWDILSHGGTALDAVEKGVNVPELDPESRSVGYGGRPDREGIVTLDACIMDHEARCGSVAFLQGIKTPISVARKVMEETPHVMLVGKGAQQFALEQGFKIENLLVEKSEKDWKDWLEKSQYQPVINVENHDTIGMLAIDAEGNMSGACTTSGAAFKMHGRVGDSPIIGAGLFLDPEAGAACATGLGEMVIRTAGSAMVVELMRHGRTPQQACEEVVGRIIRQNPHDENLQVGFLALSPKGEVGAYSIRRGFNYARYDARGNELIDAGFAK